MDMKTIGTPPREFIDAVGGGDFERVGNMLFELVRDRCDVLPSDKILDIGSGCGRVAVPFTRYLDRQAAYDGFDIVEPMVDWCRQNITSAFPNFNFKHVSLKNTLYSDSGGDASIFKFPYEDSRFDVVFATSVFTHLLPDSAKRYAEEVARVLKRDGGRALLTFFIVNDDYRRARARAETSIDFKRLGDYSVTDRNNPEAVIAYEMEAARKILESSGLQIDAFSYGFWRVKDGWTFQDAFLVSRKQSVRDRFLPRLRHLLKL